MLSKTCWKDDLGDKLEAQGVEPGCIFEFNENIRSEDLLPGGIVVSKLAPGKVPKYPWDITEAFVKHKSGEEIRLSSGNPLLISRWMFLNLC